MLTPGETAPEFELPGVEDGALDTFALADYAGPNVVVLAFYPADFSPTCTEELCSLRDIDLFTLQKEVSILGISTDTAYSHRVFAERNNLEFPLLSDNDGSVAEAYDVLYEEALGGHRRLAKRAVYVVGGDGVIHYAWASDDPKQAPDLDAVREAIAAIADDDAAVERYRVGYEHYAEGRDAFGDAHTAYIAEDWLTAGDVFARAATRLEDASEAFEASIRFAADDAVADAGEYGREQATVLRRAAKWFSQSAKHYATGDHELGDEYREDATGPYDRAVERDEPLAPDVLE